MTTNTSSRINWSVVEVVIGAALIALAFTAIASSDVSAASTRTFWSILVLLFAAVSIAATRAHPDLKHTDRFGLLAVLLHWIGVFLAIQCVFVFVSTGRLANTDTGLTSGLVLALGAFSGGAFGNWRLMIVGVALAGATLVVAFVDEYIWLLIGLALLAVIVLMLVSRLRSHKARVDA